MNDGNPSIKKYKKAKIEINLKVNFILFLLLGRILLILSMIKDIIQYVK